MSQHKPVEVLILAVPETAGSALYGMVDVLMAAGNIWQTLVRSDTGQHLFNVRIVSPGKQAFTCGNNIPVQPECSIEENPEADILILPELWLGPDEVISGRYPELMQFASDTRPASHCILPVPAPSCWPKPVCSTAARPPRTGVTKTCFAKTTRKYNFSRNPTWCLPTRPGA